MKDSTGRTTVQDKLGRQEENSSAGPARRDGNVRAPKGKADSKAVLQRMAQ